MANSVDPDQLASSEANWSDLHCPALDLAGQGLNIAIVCRTKTKLGNWHH